MFVCIAVLQFKLLETLLAVCQTIQTASTYSKGRTVLKLGIGYEANKLSFCVSYGPVTARYILLVVCQIYRLADTRVKHGLTEAARQMIHSLCLIVTFEQGPV